MKGWNEANMAGKETITRDLLEACKNMEKALCGTYIDDRQRAREKMIAAIAKAEGEQP